MIDVILYILVGVLSYIAWVVYHRQYGDIGAFILIIVLWPAYWLVTVISILKFGIDWVAFKILYLIKGIGGK